MLLTNSNIGSHPYNSIILYGVAIYIMSPEAGTYIKNIRSSHILCDPQLPNNPIGFIIGIWH